MYSAFWPAFLPVGVLILSLKIYYPLWGAVQEIAFIFIEKILTGFLTQDICTPSSSGGIRHACNNLIIKNDHTAALA